MSGIRISQFKKPKTIIVDQARVDSSYGPKSSILLETGATNYSTNGFTIEVKGLSRDSLLNGMFVAVPIQVRWKASAGSPGTAGVNLLPSLYFDLDDPVGYKGAFDSDATGLNANKMDAWTTEARVYDSLCIRPNAFKCIRNATLSINGSSFSTRVDSYYTALCKLFCDGRQEEITGAAYESYPYSNCGDSRQVMVQRGWFERCKNVNARGKVKKVSYDDAQHIKDIVFEYEVKFPLWFGPFTHLGFPGLSGFDGQTVSSIPYVSDLVLECTFQDDVLMDAFAGPDMSRDNAIRSNSPGFQPLATGAGTDWMPDTTNIWSTCLVDDAGITEKQAVVKCGLRQPKLCYMFSEPDPEKMSLASIYTLPSYRFITYEDRKAIAIDKETVKIEFPYIRLSNISSLYICMAEAARVDVGTAIAARSGRYSAANAYNSGRLGLACANRTCPIKWDTVRVSMSTSSSVLTNFVNNTITAQRQYELFQKYSANAMALTFDQWKESSQMLLFSAEELCGIGAFANSFQALTLSISFDVYRDATDTHVNAGDFTMVKGGGLEQFQTDKGKDRARAVVGRLICLEPELVSISEGAVSVEQVKLSQQEIHNQLMGGAPEVEDANQLDTLAR
ncbi:MAG: hypothetical protein CMH98_22185 [Oceanospirillaceae bacterium]|nr:hypothetical protein [Oceanospirillaceae bacterium]